MSLTTLTTKGQVTIPKKVRDSLKLKTGDKIEFTLNSNNDEAIIRAVTKKKVDDVFGMLHRKGNNRNKPISIEEMSEGIKNRMRDKFNKNNNKDKDKKILI